MIAMPNVSACPDYRTGQQTVSYVHCDTLAENELEPTPWSLKDRVLCPDIVRCPD